MQILLSYIFSACKMLRKALPAAGVKRGIGSDNIYAAMSRLICPIRHAVLLAAPPPHFKARVPCLCACQHCTACMCMWLCCVGRWTVE